MSALPVTDLVRIALVLLLAAAQAMAAYWPDLRGARHTITSRSVAVDTPVVPFGPFFAVWPVLFAACIGFAGWHAAQGAAGPAPLGWLAAALFAGNLAWETWVPRRGLDRGSAGIIAVELALALAALAMTVRWAPEDWAFWLGAVPLQLFAGWVAVAAFANLSSTLRAEGVHAPWALLFGAVGVAVGVAASTGAVAFAATAAWGLAGIAAKAGLARSWAYAGVAGGGAVMALASAVA
ncbi:hypothetical protein JQC91_13605 [Jannaschia sp. Os4]|uniref:hypothetical protein n=1 Tax=Jannaschia sp. Os4 TaxID=2807617 RepID=UPI001939460D|nr:hypothetical protein [Jannaschia sp. Os4]MBM2577339.1 hypothetical protein [Jannaschia sp. Os4]